MTRRGTVLAAMAAAACGGRTGTETPEFDAARTGGITGTGGTSSTGSGGSGGSSIGAEGSIVPASPRRTWMSGARLPPALYTDANRGVWG